MAHTSPPAQGLPEPDRCARRGVGRVERKSLDRDSNFSESVGNTRLLERLPQCRRIAAGPSNQLFFHDGSLWMRPEGPAVLSLAPPNDLVGLDPVAKSVYFLENQQRCRQ